MKKHLLFFLCMSLVATAAEIKLLTIGNSFADSVFVFLPQVTQSAGDSIVMERANIGGCSLEKHWQLADKSAKDPNFKAYPQGKPRFSLQEKLKQQAWDVVTIQQASHFSWKLETYQPYAGKLQQIVRECAPSAELVIQQTWAYRFDDSRLNSWKIDQKTMYQELTAAYNHVADELKIRVIPTGDAVQLARDTQPTPYKPYDLAILKTLKHPEPLPDETGSFVNGNRWEKQWRIAGGAPLNWAQRRQVIVKGQPKSDAEIIALCSRPGFLSKSQQARFDQRQADEPLMTSAWGIGSDRFHLNQRGQYLQALVWYGFLFNKPVSNVTFKPKSISDEDAAFLKKVAQQVIDRRQTKK